MPRPERVHGRYSVSECSSRRSGPNYRRHEHHDKQRNNSGNAILSCFGHGMLDSFLPLAKTPIGATFREGRLPAIFGWPKTILSGHVGFNLTLPNRGGEHFTPESHDHSMASIPWYGLPGAGRDAATRPSSRRSSRRKTGRWGSTSGTGR
jgi:hypothetical protein